MNLQVIEKRIDREDGQIDVVGIFPTIQGEGPFVGMPSVFVRTAGCNLQCPLCDTDYTGGRRAMSVDQIAEDVRGLRRGGLVVITGGEPFRQSCGRLVRKLAMLGYNVQFETNGTLFDESLDYGIGTHTIVCSPKTPVLATKLVPFIHYFKYVLSAEQVSVTDGLPLISLGMSGRPFRPDPTFPRDRIYVQPCDDKDPQRNEQNTKEAIASCMKYGYRLCLQTHKAVNLP
jgi:7-carboxy-7-deazaguanine synthase